MEDAFKRQDFAGFNDRQLLQIRKTLHRSDITEDVKQELFSEIDGWKFPLHFIDFETCMVAIPFTANRYPYEQVAFQFSCHTLYENGDIKHNEWIKTEPGVFPNYEFVKALREVLNKDNGAILHYSSYERTVLKMIKEQMEESDFIDSSKIIEWIINIIDKDSGRMIDMLEMVKKYYYHPSMKGSNSIKAVLPAVLSASNYLKEKYSQQLQFGINLKGKKLWVLDEEKNIPKNPYKLLEKELLGIYASKYEFDDESVSITSGGDAMTAYAKLKFADMDVKKREKIIRGLFHYCELDTLAMLMIYEHWKSME